jgi:rubrerythrin
MSELTLLDVLRVAVAVEEAGRALYEELAESAELVSQSAALRMLAIEESRHESDFRDILDRYGGRAPRDLAIAEPGEDLTKWLSLFSPDRLAEEAEKISSAEEALSFAARREMDTIMFYSEVRDMMDDELDIEVVDWIIEQERAHFHRVNDLISQLENSAT